MGLVVRRLRRLAIAAALLASPLAAAETPTFVIERITVEGARPSYHAVIAAETRLVLGRAYGERELGEAIYRVRRLPFVLHAELALRRGSDRGLYELAIQVEETRPLFYSLTLAGIYRNEAFPHEDEVEGEIDTTVGLRHAVGKWGSAFASAHAFDLGDFVPIEAGYTHYNLFGRGGFASVVLATELRSGKGSDEGSAAATLGLPLRGSHSLRASFGWTRLENRFDAAGGFSFRSDIRAAGLEWVFDTTDDPLFPTGGQKVVTGLTFSRFTRRDRGPGGVERSHRDALGAHLGGERHWLVTPRQTLSLGGRLSYERRDESGPELGLDGDSRSIRATAQHAIDVRRPSTPGRGDLRFETRLEYGLTDFGDRSSDHLTLFPSLVFRNAWGIVRLGLFYSDER